MLKPDLILKLLRFAAVGLAVMGVFMGLNWFLGHWLGEQAAFLCAYPPSVGLHFALNKRWTFGDRRAASTRQVGEYLLMVAVTFAIQWSVFTALRAWTALPGWLAAGAANVAQMAVSFGMMQVRIFAATRPATEVKFKGSGAGRRGRRWAYGGAVLLTLAWYGYVNIRSNPGLVHREPVAFYDRLTEGFVAGQTYLKLVPDPRLKTLANPWAGPQGGIPRAHDATYFNDRYYVYFGAAPVVLLLAPWRVLTGTYLADGVGTGIFCTVGFLLALWFYQRCQRRFFPGLGAGWIFAFGLALGLGSFVQFELRSTDFYQVPIACAFACSLGMANALLAVTLSVQPRRRAAMLAVASLVGALAVGARPNHIFALSSVALVGGWLGWRQRLRVGGSSRAAWVWWLAMVGPATAVGAGIAAYNYARFGSVLEFGLRYQFAAVDMRGIKLFGFERVGLAFDGYVMAGRDYSRYFPFIRQSTENIGLLTWAPFALVALLWPLTWLAGPRREQAWVLGVGALWWAALASFGSLMFYYYVFDRYVLDFLPALMLVASVTASAWLSGESQGRWGRRGLVAGVVGLLAYTGVHSFVHGLPPASAWPEMRGLARTVNRVPAWYERLVGVQYGAVEAEVEFAAGTPGAREVLLATARGRNNVLVRYLGERRAELQWVTSELEGPASAAFDFEPGRHYRLRADLGSLYPPAGHAVYGGLTEAEVKVLRRRVEVRLDGRELLRFSSSFYEAEPDGLEVGRNPWVAGVAAFRGKIAVVARVGLPASESIIPVAEHAGAVRLRLRLPSFRAQVGQPLIATGHAGAGDLFYVFYAGPNTLRFGHDAWNYPGFETADIFYDPEVVHTLDVEMGSLHPEMTAAELHAGRGRLRIRFDGRRVLDAPQPFNPSRPEEVFIGHNAIGASTSEPNFGGPRLAYERLGEWPAIPTGGARLLTLRLPAGRIAGQSEPLLVTGRNGAGEIVYIKYGDGGSFQIGYDKWNFGGPISRPIAYREGRALEVEISIGALYAPGVFQAEGIEPREWRRLGATVQVRVDGRTVLRQVNESFPTKSEQIQVGLNGIGASTCAEKFTGEIVAVETVGATRLK